MIFKYDRMYMNVFGDTYTVYNYYEFDYQKVNNHIWKTRESYKSFCQRMRLEYAGI